jgi:Na+:H+ antiporter, NhaA family
MANPDRRSPSLLPLGSWPESRRVSNVLRSETVGGALLLCAAVAAMAWANSPWSDGYVALRDAAIGPEGLHLRLTLGEWAADGLLAIFFFVAGLELKREFVAGDLRNPRRAAPPVAAAVAGMVIPAAMYIAINWDTGEDALRGWAIPTATDIAFALAVLAVISTHLPTALRTFLLTLAVVDDLLAITIIAIFYTAHLQILALLLAALPMAAFWALVRRGARSGFLLLPPAVAVWALVHTSGIHATVAGVLLALAVPVRRDHSGSEPGPGLIERLEHRWRPISVGVAVPTFAFFAAGVSLGGASGVLGALNDPVAIGVMVALVVGKVLGVTGGTWLVSRVTRTPLGGDLAWVDVLGLSMLGGIGFTVSLLISELAFGPGSARAEHATVAVLTGSIAVAIVASVVLRMRNRTYRRIAQQESLDENADDIPDVFQTRKSA